MQICLTSKKKKNLWYDLERNNARCVSLKKRILWITETAAMLALLRLNLLWVTPDAVLAFFVAAAMPCAGLASAIADQCGGDTENAVKFVLGSTILSVITIPLLYWALRLLV